jgi:hypothetical protein
MTQALWVFKVDIFSQNSQAQHKRQDKTGDIFWLIKPPSGLYPKP